MTYFRINPVLALLLLLTAIAAALPFISYAPNRLVSGEGRHLWQLWPQTIWMLVGVGCAWLTACFIPAKKGSIFALILAQFVFVLLVWGAGKAATQLAQNGSALARTSLGSGFWLAAALALLACSDAIRRISTHPLWRWLLHMQIAIIPLWLLYSGTLNDLSLMKEYANRQDVFDDALAQHLTLLFGAVLPALVIGVPLGIWCYFSTARQGAIFSLLNVIQTVPSVALFGLLIAPLAALVTAFPWLGKLGIAGTGMTPALIALVLYALLPLVRGVVVGLNQIPRDVLESARAMGMSGAQRFLHVQLPLALPVFLRSLRVVMVQTVGMAVIAALIGAGGFGALVFQGLLSSAIDLVLLGVIPVIVLAVLACGIGFSLVRCSFHPSKTIPLAEEEAGTPLLIQTDRGDGEYLAYDIAEAERKTVFLTEKTKMTDASGRKISKASLAEGDLLAAELDEDGKTLISVDYSSNAIRTEEATGLTVNRKKRTLTNKAENLSYSYEKESVFFYDGEEIDAADLAPCDELLLKLVGDTVWSVEVQAYHGYIVVENTDAVKNGKIQLDEAEAVPLTEGMQLAAAEGHHTVTVTGSNIETRKDAVVVEAGEETVYDLSKAQEKMGVIIINANVKDYKLYINGAAAESPAVLPMGEYDLVILKNGYTEWSRHVTLDKDTLNVTAELQKDVQYGTLTVTADVDGAWVYINGEEYGVAPMQVNLPYGSYNVMLEKSGYQSYKQSIQISSQTAAIHATME